MFRIIRTSKILCFASLAMIITAPTPAQNIYTVAGGGPNNVPALSAAIGPSGMVFDASGNYYLADGSRVFRVDRNGQLTVYAGVGDHGYSGDGGPATSAELAYVSGIALDGAGNLFVADYFYCVVRRVDATTGIITTIAGNGTAGFG